MARSWLVFSALVLLAVVYSGSAIKCFQCQEEKGTDGICRDDYGNEHVTVECAQSCITHTLAPISIGAYETTEFIQQDCSDPVYCKIGVAFMEEKMGFKTRACTSCDFSYCNSAFTTIPSIILVAALAVKHHFL